MKYIEIRLSQKLGRGKHTTVDDNRKGWKNHKLLFYISLLLRGGENIFSPCRLLPLDSIWRTLNCENRCYVLSTSLNCLIQGWTQNVWKVHGIILSSRRNTGLVPSVLIPPFLFLHSFGYMVTNAKKVWQGTHMSWNYALSNQGSVSAQMNGKKGIVFTYLARFRRQEAATSQIFNCKDWNRH